MSKDKLRFVGCGSTAKYLTVYFDRVVGGIRYPEVIWVPWRDLTEKEIMYNLNLAVAARLREMWESEPPPWDEDLPLPGIG